MKILKFNKPEELKILKTPSVPVTEFNDELRENIKKMQDILKFAHGYALSAPQVGINQRFWVWDDPAIKCPDKVIINPEIIEATGRMKYNEYCLSFGNSDLYVRCKRKISIKMKYQDIEGNEKEYSVHGGDEVVCIQHELDHLDGILISDHGGLVKG